MKLQTKDEDLKSFQRHGGGGMCTDGSLEGKGHSDPTICATIRNEDFYQFKMKGVTIFCHLLIDVHSKKENFEVWVLINHNNPC